jgi:hypothetical protein
MTATRSDHPAPLNQLYYGDNLDVLRRHIPDESVDLIYLDPPFNSNASYNVLFAERDGTQAASQIKAFGDTWKWDEGAARACAEMIEAGGKVSEVMQAFRTFLGDNDMMAYLAMMTPRLVELRRVLSAAEGGRDRRRAIRTGSACGPAPAAATACEPGRDIIRRSHKGTSQANALPCCYTPGDRRRLRLRHTGLP